MSLSAKERVKRFYSQFSNEDHVLIPINADPDAIASAMAVKRLLWRKTASITISNVNVIERPDNLALIRLTGVSLVPFNTLDLSRYTRTVMVDSQPDHHPDFQELSPAVIIDHHPAGTSSKAAYTDIRPSYGAAASILVEYLRAAKIKPSAKLATALYYAIKTDTSDFERPTLMEDLNAFQFVFRYANPVLARRLEWAEIRRDFLKFFKLGLEVVRIRKGRAFAHLGPVVSPDACVQIADFFMHIDAVNWSIISGTHKGNLVIILRNDGIRKNAGRVAKQAFDKLGSAGGHKSAARAEVPLKALQGLVDYKDRTKLGNWIARQIQHQAGQKRPS